MKPIKTHLFSTGRYLIITDKVDGLHAADAGKAFLYINGELSDAAVLETACHEGMHAEFPYLTEDRVTEAAANIGRLLHRLGFRRAKDGEA